MTQKAKIWGCINFFGDFRLRDTFQKRIAPKSIEIDMDKLRMKFSALNVDFDGPSLVFEVNRKPADEGIKERYPPVEVLILPLLASLSRKRLQIGMSMLPITTSTSDELFSRINIDDFERP